MRKHIKTIICMVLVAVALPWLAENYWRFDPRLEYKGNDGVEHREVHMIVDGQEIALKLENNHLVGYTPVSKSNNSVTYVFYRDYGDALDLLSEYCWQRELSKKT